MNITELTNKYPSASFGEGDYVLVSRRLDLVRHNEQDWRLSEWVDLGTWNISLQHQCDEWEIGSPEKAKQFISDVQEAIAYCEARP